MLHILANACSYMTFYLILWIHSSNILHLVIYIIFFAYIWFWFANILFRMSASMLMSNFLIQSLPGFDRMDWEMFSLFLVFERVYFRMGSLVDFACKIMSKVFFFMERVLISDGISLKTIYAKYSLVSKRMNFGAS